MLSVATRCCVQRLSHIAIMSGAQWMRTWKSGCCVWVWKNVSSAADSACFIPAMRCVKPGFTNSALRPEIGCVRTTGCLLEMTSPVVSPGTNSGTRRAVDGGERRRDLLHLR